MHHQLKSSWRNLICFSINVQKSLKKSQKSRPPDQGHGGYREATIGLFYLVKSKGQASDSQINQYRLGHHQYDDF